MRSNGIKRTKEFANVSWYEGVGENTGMESDAFDFVTFGSSFNVCDRQLALKETARILKSGGYFACMWNHRDLEDPTQKGIEDIIKRNIEGYSYGTRREEQTEVINQSGLFEEVQFVSGRVEHELCWFSIFNKQCPFYIIKIDYQRYDSLFCQCSFIFYINDTSPIPKR